MNKIKILDIYDDADSFLEYKNQLMENARITSII